MPTYDFQGIDENSKVRKGTVEADSEKSARQKLRRDGVYATKVSPRGGSDKNRQIEGKKSVKGKKIKLVTVSDMTKQLATLIKARVPLVEALAAVVEQQENENFKEMISDIKAKVNEGSSLAKAMREHPQVFSPIYTSMVRAGEASGNLAIVLNRLSEFIEKSVRLRNKIVAAMVYPSFLGTVSIIIVMALLTFIVPRLTEMFEGQGKALPMLTIVLIFMSDTVKNYWYMFFTVIFMGFILFKKYIATAKGRKWFDHKLVTVPLLGSAMQKIAIARFSRTLSTLLASGVPLLTALDIVKEVVNNVVIAEAIENVKVRVREGDSMAKVLRDSGYFPPIVTRMIAIGEKSGGKELEEMLASIAESYDNEVENALVGLTSVIEPLMIICLGGFVAFVVVAIILPIMELYKVT